MRAETGFLRRLGESTVDMNTETKTYSVIEVGNRVIPNVTVSRKLANFVSDGVGDEVTLHLHGAVIVACTVNGKTYYESQFHTRGGTLIALVCGVIAAFALMMTTTLLFFVVFGLQGGGAAIFALLMFPVGAVLGYNWGKRKFATPKELAQWKAQGAVAV